MCTSSEHFIWNWGGISDSLSEHFIWKYELISLFRVWVSVCTSSEHFIWKRGDISESEHFIWKFGSQCILHLKLGGYIWELIWVLHLTSWPSCALHLKTWPNSTVCFEWALIDDIDQWRLHLLSLAVSCGGYIWEPIWERHLKIWTHFRFYSCFTEVFLYYIRKTNESSKL